MSLVTEILSWVEVNVLSLSAVFLKGEECSGRLPQPETTEREGDWVPNQEVFDLIVRRWGGPPEVDLFALSSNAKTP